MYPFNSRFQRPAHPITQSLAVTEIIPFNGDKPRRRGGAVEFIGNCQERLRGQLMTEGRSAGACGRDGDDLDRFAFAI